MRSRDFPRVPYGADEPLRRPMQQNGPVTSPVDEAYNRAAAAIRALSAHDQTAVLNRLFRALPPT